MERAWIRRANGFVRSERVAGTIDARCRIASRLVGWGVIAPALALILVLLPAGVCAEGDAAAGGGHWAFVAPERAPIPDEADTSPDWRGNVIDRLLAVRHRTLGLTAQPEAAPEVWLRRVHFDLIGLPPTPDQRAAFLADPSPAARERVVEELLASPHYGERWGRHFMDIWRYSDWWGLGDQLRYSQKHIWHWRDWIVAALNEDKGYDRMILEMLAGDEVAPEDPDVLAATGFLCRPYYLFNRTTWLDQVVEHTSRGFLGLTMQCVKCHDHKYDPIPHADYYRMRAVFEPYHVRVDALPGETDLERDGLPRAFDLHLDRPTFIHLRGDEKEPDESTPIPPGPPSIFGEFEVEPVRLPVAAHSPHLRPHVRDDQLERAARDIEAARGVVAQAQAAVEAARMADRKAAGEGDEAATEAGSAALTETPSEPSTDDAVVFVDDFSAPKPELWEAVDGEWRHEDGVLRQEATTDGPSRLRSVVSHPVDFEARLSFRILDGTTWKSVGFCFDVNAENSDDMLAYVSAHGDGSVQVAPGRGGEYTYPPDSRRAHPIRTGEPIELVVRLRGALANVSVNGTQVVAWSVPEPRSPGRFQLLTYDARAEFTGFSLSTLPPDAEMTAAAGSPIPSAASPVVVAEAELRAAEAALAAAEARIGFIETSWRADEAKAAGTEGGTAELAPLASAAAEAQSRLRIAEAQEALHRAEIGLLKAEPEKRAEAETMVGEAEAALTKAHEAAADPGEAYTSLSASIKALEGPDETEENRRLPYPDTSTGRRLALARWIADRSNPLTARVVVNHIWTRRFSNSFVADESDFGLRCPPPAHQAILDTLAVELMEQGWSLKHLHRLMVHSRLYRTSSSLAGADPATTEADPDNLNLWRMNPRRLESQAIRDSLVAVAGLLDPAVGGPPIDPERDEESLRRALYFRQTGEIEHRLLGAFDNVSVVECYRRRESVTPQQALALANSRLTHSCALALARRLAEGDEDAGDAGDAGDGGDEAFVRAAWVAVLSREPTRRELDACLDALRAFSEPAGDGGGGRGGGGEEGSLDPLRAETLLIQALMNHNDFVTVR